MAKQQKQVKSTPDIYQGLDITKNQNCYVVEDVHFLFYIFDNAQSVHIIKEAIQKRFNGIGDLLDLGIQTMLAYHENFFKVSPDKKQDPTVTAQYVWAKMISLAVDRRSNQVPVSASGRKSTIGLCQYRLTGKGNVENLKTPQAKACLKLLKDCLAKNIIPDTEDQFVTEEVLKQYVIDNAGELHTKQDPWRIFQYYRPNLISEGIITRN